MPGAPAIGDRLRDWRERRRLSQMALALQAEVSTRHLSFVETGRAQPGRALIVRLADELQIPLRERNGLLIAAGFAPVFEFRRFDDPSFDPVRTVIDITLERHKPFPAYLIDRQWNVVISNAAVPELVEGVDAELLRPPVNMVRMMLHPRGLAERIQNFGVWWSYLVAQIRRQIDLTADPRLEQLLRETLSYSTRPTDAAAYGEAGRPAVPLDISTRIGQLSFIGATTVFGGPLDATLDEIAIEALHPADAFTEEAVRRAVAAASTA